MKNFRIIFMGSPAIAKDYLQDLVKNNFNVIGVFTQPPRASGRGMNVKKSPVHEEAISLKIPFFCYDNLNNIDAVNTFKKLKCDIVIIMAYGILLPKKILEFPKYGCINIHLSLLPRWRGASPVEHALINGDKKSGVTIFKLIEKLDAGEIISQDSFIVNDEFNNEKLFKKLNDLGKKLLITTLPDYFDNKIKLTKQSEQDSTYAPKVTTLMRKIDFYESILNVFNQIRAFSQKPGAWFIYKNERIKILSCEKKLCTSIPSTIINEKFHIGCKDGIILPTMVQREGKKPMEINEFLKGFKFTIGHQINA
tara:strand:- start:355 stop:1281 length:927 start_codon:yes stop_codon:yes gene_type:complete